MVWNLPYYGEGGGATKREGGGGIREVLPLHKGGGGGKSFGVVFTPSLEDLAIL